MKHYLDCKKLFSFATFRILILILSLTPLVVVYSQSAEEIKDKIDQKSADIQKLEEQIKVYQSELDDLGKEKNSLSVSLKELDLTKKKLVTDISVTQHEIDKTNLKIQGLSSDIGDKEVAIKDHKNSIALQIRRTDAFERGDILQTLLSENDFTEIWNDIDNIETVKEIMLENITKLRETKGALESARVETIAAKNELLAFQGELADQKKIVTQNASEKNKLLAQTKNSETTYQKLVQEQLTKKLLFEKDLRDYESELKFILDPTTLPPAGVLSWPLERIFVTQEFGAKTGPHRTYANGHNGTDFRARTPLPIYAMADGTVKGIGDTDVSCPGVSFGKWIFIEYNNGLSSTFGHLSFIKVGEGQRVARGEVVGYTGGTGRVTGPHLHVSLYASKGVSVDTVPSISCPGRILKQPIAAINAYLDPMYYLPPYVPSP